MGTGFNSQLESVLNSIVDTLHGPFGVLKERFMAAQSTDPAVLFAEALQDGAMPFAAESKSGQFRTSEKELFVMEQVEATVRASLEDVSRTTTLVYKELAKLYQQAYKQLKVKDFHAGDWTAATPQEKEVAEAKHDFLFKLDRSASGKLNHLARFAALGLANEQVANVLKRSFKETTEVQPTTLLEKLTRLFNNALTWLVDQATHTH